jgi:hypothetical protein
MNYGDGRGMPEKRRGAGRGKTGASIEKAKANRNHKQIAEPQPKRNHAVAQFRLGDVARIKITGKSAPTGGAR